MSRPPSLPDRPMSGARRMGSGTPPPASRVDPNGKALPRAPMARPNSAKVTLSSVNTLLYSWQRPEFHDMVIASMEALIRQTTANIARLTEAVEDGAEPGTAVDDSAQVAVPFQDLPDLSYLVTVVKQPQCCCDRTMWRAVMKLLQLFSRRAMCRHEVGETVTTTAVTTVVRSLEVAIRERDLVVAADAAKFLSNACTCNDHCLVCIDAVPVLLRCITLPDVQLQVGACGTLQALCITSLGREAVVRSEGIASIVALLYSRDSGVLARAISTLHNVTVDLNACRLVMEVGGVQPIVLLVRHADRRVVTSAAGTLQNLSRDKDCADVVRQSGAVQALMDLLVHPSEHTMSFCVGAILNLHSSEKGPESRKDLKRTLSDCLAVAMLKDVFQPR